MFRLWGKRLALWMFICLAVTVLFVPFGAAMAAGGGGESGEQGQGAGAHGGHDDSGRIRDLFYRFINFALLVVILFLALRKAPIKSFFSARREEIKKRLDDLSKEKEEAEQRLRQLEGELSELENRKTKIIKEFEAEGLAEKERIIAEATQRSKQILEQTELIIQREIQTAKDRIRQDVVEMAAQKAQELIASEIKDSDQDHLVQEFLEKVEKLH